MECSPPSTLRPAGLQRKDRRKKGAETEGGEGGIKLLPAQHSAHRQVRRGGRACFEASCSGMQCNISAILINVELAVAEQ